MSAEILTKQFETLNISYHEALRHDIDYIIWLYYKEIPVINQSILKIKRNTFNNITDLYCEILNILDEKDEKKNLLEMMPLIDEYLSYCEII